jgi:hypothetical protein
VHVHILLSQPKRFTETVGLIPEEMPPSRHIDPTFENETNCMSLSWKCHPVARSHAPRRDPVDGSVLREPQSEMMQICNTNNKSSLSEFNSQCCRSAPVGSRDKGAAVFWLLLLLFGVTLGIALAGQRLLERHSSRGVKK